MNTDINRRDFMKVAGVSTAGFTIATGFSPFTYAQNSKVSVGCIGVGGQGCFHIREGLTHNPDVQIVAIADVYQPNQKAALPRALLSNAKQYLRKGEMPTPEQIAAAKALPAPTACYDYREVLANPSVDAVVISSPLNTHFRITMDALDAGKHVFCEKTLVQTIEEGRTLITRCHELNRWVQVGHQRRYNPKYNFAQHITYEHGLLGRITHINAQWHRNQLWRKPVPVGADGLPYQLNEEEKKYITDLDKHMNWRLYDEISGGLFTELATHQTDIANWFLRAMPSRVCAMGGVDYWRDGRTTDDNIELMFEYQIKRSSPGFMAMKPRTTLMDESTANRPYSVRFMYTSILSCEKRGCSELIQGDRGSLELTENVCKFYPERWALAEAKEQARAKAEQNSRAASSGGETPDASPQNDAHKQAERTVSGGTIWSDEDIDAGKELFGTCIDINPKKNPSAIPDAYQFKAFTDCIQNGGVPMNNQMVGYTAAITALAAMQSRKEGRIVDIDPAWYTFDFETPSFYEYDPAWGDKKCEEPKCPCCGKPMPKPEEFAAPKCQVCGQKLPQAKEGDLFVPCPEQTKEDAPK